MTTIRILSCNVRGLADVIKRKQMYNYFKEKDADVIFLQETHCSKNSKRIFKSQWRGKSVFANGTTEARGVAVLFANGLDIKIEKIKADEDGRYILCTVKINDKRFLFANIYAPNEDRPEFYNNILELVMTNDAEHVVLGGDLNVHLSSMDKKGSEWKLTKSASCINNFLEENSWVDVWRFFHEDIFQFTWRKSKPKPIFTRIDYFLVPEGLVDMVSDCEILPGFLSDHSFIKLDLKVIQGIKGPGYWKLNTSLLTEKPFIDGINDIIDRSYARYAKSNPIKRLEFLKFDIRDFAKEYSIKRAHTRKENLKNYRTKANSLQKKLNMINLSSANAVALIEKINKKLDLINIELDKLTRYVVQGQMLRLKVKWVEESEKNSKYFFSLEKHRSKAKCMNKIIVNDKVITNPNEILMQQRNFYQQLYTRDSSIKFEMNMRNDSSSKLDDTQQILLDSEITVEEIAAAIKSMANNKTPRFRRVKCRLLQGLFCQVEIFIA